MKKEFPNLPLIFDPSHVAGKRDLIYDLSKTALDLRFDGLMVEAHYNPDNAWSDSKQQLLPEKLLEMINCLVNDCNSSTSNPSIEKLLELDSRIDILKEQLGNVFLKKREIKNKLELFREK